MFRWLTLLTAFANPFLTTTITNCKSDAGHDVDWWVAIKAPKGTDYLYADSTAPAKLTPSVHSMNDTTAGALAHTVRQLWNPDTPYVIWNDEPLPVSTNTLLSQWSEPLAAAPTYNFSYGHTKGILTDGFWLVHSIPLFPAGPALAPSYQALGSNAWIYAQSAACFMVNATTTLDTMGTLFQLYHPNIYDVGVTPSVSTAVQALAAGEFKTDPVCSVADLTLPGIQGVAHLFGKTPAWNADLWSACVAPKMGVDLAVESWLRGSEIGSVCNGPVWTVDVEEVDYGGGFTWSEYNDHGKWATDPNGTIFCIGEINRMTTQYARAGGAVCWRTPLAVVFANAITSQASC
jgi:deoxyribonuclease-2